MRLHYRNLNRQLEPRAIPYLSVLPQPPECAPGSDRQLRIPKARFLEYLRPLARRKLVDPQNEYFNAN